MYNIEAKGKELGIVYLNEKKWIMAYFYKMHNYKFTMFKNQFLRLWNVWWHSDFPWEEDGLRIRVSGNKIMNCPKGGNQSINTEWTEFFTEIINWVVNTIVSYEIETIKVKLRKNRNQVYIPEELKFKADKLGMVIRTANIRYHPMRLKNSFIVQLNNQQKGTICGNSKFTMQLKDIQDFINKRYEKKVRKKEINITAQD